MLSDGKLKQSLLRILPFVLGSLEGNAYVHQINELIEIVQIVFAPVLTIATVSRLKSLIETQHMKHWKELFLECNITLSDTFAITNEITGSNG